MNSNTDGSLVANVGFWPASLVAAVIATTQGILNSLQGLQAGELLPAGVDFSKGAGDNKIADEVMAEIARRIIVTFEKQEQGNIVYSPQPPDDKTKAWIPTDAITGLPIDGVLKIWNEDSQAWVSAPSNAPEVIPPPEKRFVSKHIAAGASTVNFDFDTDILTSNYFPTLTFTTQNADETWAAAPGSYPTAFGYLITNKTNLTCTIAFYAVPTGGMNAELQVEAKPA